MEQGDIPRTIPEEFNILYNGSADGAAKHGRSLHHQARHRARNAVKDHARLVSDVNEFQLAVVEQLWNDNDASDEKSANTIAGAVYPTSPPYCRHCSPPPEVPANLHRRRRRRGKR